MKLVGYSRVSTDRQAEEGLGAEIQRQAIRDWAKEHGHSVIFMEADDGVSGTRELDDRPGLAEALRAIRTGIAEGLIVYRLDRLARDLILQEQLLREVWRLGGVAFSTSAAESSFLVEDPTDPSRRLIRQVLGAVSEYERAMVRLRLQSGRDRKAAAGGYAGFGSPALGWRAVDGALIPHIDEQRAVDLIVGRHASGASHRQIIADLEAAGLRPKRSDRWHPTTVARVLRRHAPAPVSLQSA
jgi:DNA invertase Pin-like site-specific DNA recombinase